MKTKMAYLLLQIGLIGSIWMVPASALELDLDSNYEIKMCPDEDRVLAEHCYSILFEPEWHLCPGISDDFPELCWDIIFEQWERQAA